MNDINISLPDYINMLGPRVIIETKVAMSNLILKKSFKIFFQFKWRQRGIEDTKIIVFLKTDL